MATWAVLCRSISTNLAALSLAYIVQVIVISFTLIIGLMLGTFAFVLKVGAVRFNVWVTPWQQEVHIKNTICMGSVIISVMLSVLQHSSQKQDQLQFPRTHSFAELGKLPGWKMLTPSVCGRMNDTTYAMRSGIIIAKRQQAVGWLAVKEAVISARFLYDREIYAWREAESRMNVDMDKMVFDGPSHPVATQLLMSLPMLAKRCCKHMMRMPQAQQVLCLSWNAAQMALCDRGGHCCTIML